MKKSHLINRKTGKTYCGKTINESIEMAFIESNVIYNSLAYPIDRTNYESLMCSTCIKLKASIQDTINEWRNENRLNQYLESIPKTNHGRARRNHSLRSLRMKRTHNANVIHLPYNPVPITDPRRLLPETTITIIEKPIEKPINKKANKPIIKQANQSKANQSHKPKFTHKPFNPALPIQSIEVKSINDNADEIEWKELPNIKAIRGFKNNWQFIELLSNGQTISISEWMPLESIQNVVNDLLAA